MVLLDLVQVYQVNSTKHDLELEGNIKISS